MKQKASRVSKAITKFQKNQKTISKVLEEDRVLEKTGRVGFKNRCLKIYLLWPFHIIIIGIKHTAAITT